MHIDWFLKVCGDDDVVKIFLTKKWKPTEGRRRRPYSAVRKGTFNLLRLARTLNLTVERSLN